MRQSNVGRLMVALGVLALVICFGSSSAMATACEDACLDQFDLDVAACTAQRVLDDAEATADDAECRVTYNGDPPGLKGCLNAAAQKFKQAIKREQQCLKKANRDYDQCIAACTGSPTGGD